MRKSLFFVGLLFWGMMSCDKHEVIPAPEPKVDLKAHFVGNIDGTTLELTENVQGYHLITNQTKNIVPPPAMSTASYFSEMRSSSQASGIKIGLGSVSWSASASERPPVQTFNDFHELTNLPAYATDAVGGFEVIYTDASGEVWKSDPSSTPKSVEFPSSLSEQGSDNTGDYAKFKCSFSCNVYRLDTVTNTTISLSITDATFTGWFKR